MTNLDSILKSRDITLPTKVCIVKAMVFPVVMYRCESWTIKKAEHQRIDAFELWYLRGAGEAGAFGTSSWGNSGPHKVWLSLITAQVSGLTVVSAGVT